MPSHRPPRLDRLELGRTAALGGALAGLVGGAATLLLLLPAALWHDLPPEAGLVARAALVGSEEPLAGACLHLAGGALLGGLFGWQSGLRSGLELGLRGLALALVLWGAGWVVLPFAAPHLQEGPLAPSLQDYLLFGALLGLQSRFSRRMLQRRWRRFTTQARRPLAERDRQPSHVG